MRPVKHNFLKVTLCLVLALLIGAAPVSALAASKKDTVVSILKCTVDGGRLREGPGSSYDVITSLRKGDKVLYIGAYEGAFCLVRTMYGQNGYIYKGFLSYYGAARRSQIFYATDDGVTLYKKPKSGASKSTTLAKGEHIIVYKVVGNWGYAKTLRGKAGFVTAKNLKGL